MALKNLKLNNRHYLHKAFDPHHRERLVRSARQRRSVYLVICFIGVGCVIAAGALEKPALTGLSLLLSTLSMVVVTKYDTQVFFLEIIEKEATSRERALTSEAEHPVTLHNRNRARNPNPLSGSGSSSVESS